MKQKLVMFLMILILAFQPFSIDLKGSSALANTDNEENCGCSSESELKVKETGVFKDQKVLNNIKKELQQEWKSNNSLHKTSEFDWNNSEFVSFGKEKEGLMFPAKANNEEKDVRLVTVYDKNTGEVEDFTLVVSTLAGEEMKVKYTTLMDEDIVGLTIDTETNEIEEREVYNEKNEFSLISQNKASASWASDTVDCLKSKWRTANKFTQYVCGGACSSVVFGGNVIGATVCASCLGAYAMVCTIH